MLLKEKTHEFNFSQVEWGLYLLHNQINLQVNEKSRIDYFPRKVYDLWNNISNYQVILDVMNMLLLP